MGLPLSFIATVIVALFVSWLYFVGQDTLLTTLDDPDRNRVAVQLAKDYASDAVDGQVKLYVKESNVEPALSKVVLRTRPVTVYKPRFIETFMKSRFSLDDLSVEWDELVVSGPDIEDRHTLQQLAMMSGNAYALPGQKNWYDLDEAWNQVRPALFGPQGRPC